MLQEQIVRNVMNKKLIAIVRGMETEYIIALGKALYAGGINMIEVTFNQSCDDRFAATTSSIERLKEALGDDDTGVNYSLYFFPRSIRNLISEYVNSWNLIPVLQLFVMPGFYSWLMLFVVVERMFKQDWKHVAMTLPAVLTILICFVSPVNGYLRYMLPVGAVSPLYMSFLLNKK